MSGGRRRLAAIMFTDMVGYTALGQRDEGLSLQLVEEQKTLLRPIFRKHNGREVKSMGDARLAEFPNALDAVRCAYDIQRTIREFNFAAAVERRLRLRIGLHLGDVVESNGDISGDAVNVASRIEPLASEGGICMSQQVYDQVRNKFELPLESLGKKSLKNVRGAIEVYRILLPWEKSGQVEQETSDKHRLAVLPLVNIGADPNNEYFADGLTEEVISTISKVRDLSVISRTSAMKYKSVSKTVREIGSELQAGSILEGSVRKMGNTVRVAVQLIDVAEDKHLWAQSYDRELENIFAIQSDIARQVADALSVQLLSPERKDIERKATESTEAYTHYLKGKYFWNRGMLEYDKTLNQFELAIQKDPAFALGYSALADIYLVMSRNGYVSPKLGYPKAIDLAKKAISLDETLAEPYAMLAAIRQEFEWRWDEAETGFRHAISLNPSHSTAHAWYALYLGHVGRCEAGIGEAKRAIELDPLGPRGHQSSAEEYLFANQYEKAVDAAETLMELNPESPIGYGIRATAEVQKGMYDEAIADFLESDKLFVGGATRTEPDVQAQRLMGRLGHAYAISGRTADAKRILQDLERKLVPASPKSQFQSPPNRAMEIGLVHLGLGNNQTALEWLGRAADEHTAQIIHLKCEPIFSSIRGEPAYEALLKKIGLDRASLGN